MPRVKATEANRRPAAEVRFIEPTYALAIKNLPMKGEVSRIGR
jgi:hypothetical protein